MPGRTSHRTGIRWEISQPQHSVSWCTDHDTADRTGLHFPGITQEIAVGRYHSWVVDTEKLPETLAVTAVSPEGQIMALKHREYDVRGIQFHPESVLTPDGKQIMKNWLEE